MALTRSIQAVLQGSPISGTHQPDRAELDQLLSELVVDGSNPLTKAEQFLAVGPSASSGYGAGSGGTVTQATSRTTAVTLNKPCGSVVMVTAAGSATPAQFTINNSLVTLTDTFTVAQRGGSNSYGFSLKATTGAIVVTFWSLIGTASDSPTLNFAIVNASVT